MTSGLKRTFSQHKLAITAISGSLGLTYLYYTSPAPRPSCVWTSLPKPILNQFSHGEPRGVLWNVLSTLVVGVTGTLSKGVLKASQIKVHGLEKFVAVVEDPRRTKGIITVSNHESVLDDPVLWGVLPWDILFSIDKIRWVLGAADICYTTLSWFFAFGQTIPTIRGAGIYQPGIKFAIDKANQKGWIHIYPEAKVSQVGKMIRFKWGVGRIIMDMNHEPIVIPIWHQGMHLAKPLQGTRLIHLNQPITLVFGEPIQYSDILQEWKDGKTSREETRIRITQRLYDALEKLEVEYTRTPL